MATTRAIKHIVTWQDSGRSSVVPPNPVYPHGIALDASDAGAAKCRVTVPYPAKRIGVYTIDCKVCGLRVELATSGRRDDPTSITLPCGTKR